MKGAIILNVSPDNGAGWLRDIIRVAGYGTVAHGCA